MLYIQKGFRIRKAEGTHFHAAYHANAPCGLYVPSMAGNVIEITKLKNQPIAVMNDTPTSRMYKGNASAEYYDIQKESVRY